MLDKFTNLVIDKAEKNSNETNFIKRVQAGIDADTGSIQVSHGLSIDMVAFENSCKIYDSHQPQMLKSIADIAYE